MASSTSPNNASETTRAVSGADAGGWKPMVSSDDPDRANASRNECGCRAQKIATYPPRIRRSHAANKDRSESGA